MFTDWMVDKEKSKDSLIQLLSRTRIAQFSSYIAEDLVDECLDVCRQVNRKERDDYPDIDSVIYDYLDLGAGYVGMILAML